MIIRDRRVNSLRKEEAIIANKVICLNMDEFQMYFPGFPLPVFVSKEQEHWVVFVSLINEKLSFSFRDTRYE